MPRILYTIGHSTHPLDEFVAMIKAHGVAAVADVRSIPRSRRYPHFNDTHLAVELPRAGIEYLSFKSLGGRRHARKDSINLGWHNEGFRGYADYMQTPAFENGLNDLQEQAHRVPTAIMCAEAVPWRCHRSLISDAMLARGWQVMDIFSPTSAKPHGLTSFAVVEETKITYPTDLANDPQLFG
jgi:uncharacterized protein (DUF488 family)